MMWTTVNIEHFVKIFPSWVFYGKHITLGSHEIFMYEVVLLNRLYTKSQLVGGEER